MTEETEEKLEREVASPVSARGVPVPLHRRSLTETHDLVSQSNQAYKAKQYSTALLGKGEGSNPGSWAWNFFTVHLSYFIGISLFGGIMIQAIEGANISFVDALFTSVSAVTGTGLQVRDLASELSVPTVVLVAFLMLFGSNTLIPLATLYIRRVSIKKQLSDITAVDSEQSRRQTLMDTKRKFVILRAIYKLSNVLVVFLVLVHLLGFSLLSIYVYGNSKAHAIVTMNSKSTFGFVVFHVISAFHNVGLSTFSQSLIPLASHTFPLFIIAMLILLGNSLFSPVLRLCVRLARRLFPEDQESYDFLLDHPRQCFTHLFSATRSTILAVLALIWVFSQWLIALALVYHKQNIFIVDAQEAPGYVRFFNTLFQSVSTRSAGFTFYEISHSSSALLFLMALLMYTAPIPVGLTLRSSAIIKDKKKDDSVASQSDNVFVRSADKSLSSPRQHEEQSCCDKFGKVVSWLKNRNYLLQQASLLIILVLLLLAFEDVQFDSDASEYSLFKVIFEVSSAFGNVGLSLGTSKSAFLSFSAALSSASKFILCIIMIMGRHRALPTSLDSAVSLHLDDEEEDQEAVADGPTIEMEDMDTRGPEVVHGRSNSATIPPKLSRFGSIS
jgi:Trk-type K+ transport system membrane component